MNLLRLIFFLLLFSGNTFATHIVGGGFTYSKMGGDSYLFRLTLYFDAINGSPGALDDDLTCYIFRKADNELMDSIFMPLLPSNQYVPFTNPICSQGSGVSTRILIYEEQILLPEWVYDSPEGYYVVWERCCRNNVITNILNPQFAGQTFYMEFPPVVRGGPFINNSPVFQPITSDYPCINEPFYLSFQAVDPDGDSLVYSMTTPLKGNSTNNFPRNIGPFPAPYDQVYWGFGYSELNAIPGNPALNVNPLTGMLFCRPYYAGLFVFSVKCEEFRNGVKIGEVRREMQLLVKDCILNTAPVVVIPNPTTGSNLKKNDTLVIESGTERTCKVLKLTDLQKDQTLRYRIVTLDSNTPTYLRKDTTLKFLPGQDSLRLNFCIPACAVSPPNNPWKIAIIVTDNGCSLPKSDTLILNLVARTRALKNPTIKTVGLFPDTLQVVQTEFLNVPFQATQPQNTNIRVYSFFTDSSGISIPVLANGIQLPSGFEAGILNTQFSWPEICFLPHKQPLKLTTIVETTECGLVKSDTLIKWLNIIPKDLNVEISSSYTGSSQIDIKERGSIHFDITGTANDNRPLKLFSIGDLKSIPGFGFQDVSGNGSVTSGFGFETNCATPPGPFQIRFLASSRFCGADYSDSITYRIKVNFEPDSLGNIPNLITADGNIKNDGLLMDQILKEDNCLFTFDFVEIFNRWGNRVYYSEDRNFAWKPDRWESGVYFFALHFKEITFRNWVLVVK